MFLLTDLLKITLKPKIFASATIGVYALTSNTELDVLRHHLVRHSAIGAKKINNCTVTAEPDLGLCDKANAERRQ